MGDTLHPVGVSVLLVNAEGKVLMSRRREKARYAAGLLSTPGGRIELTETRFECAVREFKEECGAELDDSSLVDIGVKEHFRYDIHYFMWYIKATRWTGEIRNPEPDKHEDWEWFDPLTIQYGTCTEPTDILVKLKPVDIQGVLKALRQKLIASDIAHLDKVSKYISQVEGYNASLLEELGKVEIPAAISRCTP